jgi:hypothetical protein
MAEIFIGSEALTHGKLTEFGLRRRYRAVYPDVYTPKRHELSLRDRTVGAWLWSRRRAVIAGAAASALHGAGCASLRTRSPLLPAYPSPRRARTAFDLGRHLPRQQAGARLDALMRAAPFSAEVDAGAQSPKESWLRLLLVDAGLPAPTTQIPVLDGYRVVALLDMGWEECKVAVEYDGDQHQ